MNIKRSTTLNAFDYKLNSSIIDSDIDFQNVYKEFKFMQKKIDSEEFILNKYNIPLKMKHLTYLENHFISFKMMSFILKLLINPLKYIFFSCSIEYDNSKQSFRVKFLKDFELNHTLEEFSNSNQILGLIKYINKWYLCLKIEKFYYNFGIFSGETTNLVLFFFKTILFQTFKHEPEQLILLNLNPCLNLYFNDKQDNGFLCFFLMNLLTKNKFNLTDFGFERQEFIQFYKHAFFKIFNSLKISTTQPMTIPKEELILTPLMTKLFNLDDKWPELFEFIKFQITNENMKLECYFLNLENYKCNELDKTQEFDLIEQANENEKTISFIRDKEDSINSNDSDEIDKILKSKKISIKNRASSLHFYEKKIEKPENISKYIIKEEPIEKIDHRFALSKDELKQILKNYEKEFIKNNQLKILKEKDDLKKKYQKYLEKQYKAIKTQQILWYYYIYFPDKYPEILKQIQEKLTKNIFEELDLGDYPEKITERNSERNTLPKLPQLKNNYPNNSKFINKNPRFNVSLETDNSKNSINTLNQTRRKTNSFKK